MKKFQEQYLELIKLMKLGYLIIPSTPSIERIGSIKSLTKKPQRKQPQLNPSQ